MTYIYEAATTKYDDDKLLLRKAMGKIQNLCKISDGYILEEPVSKFGWTFFQMLMKTCLLYTSPSPRDRQKSRMPSSA